MSGNAQQRLSAPGTPSWNPGWYAMTDIYWDPSGANGGNDGNSGAVGSPVLTFAEITRRYGSTRPRLNQGQSTTIHLLSSQTSDVDTVFFEPYVSGGGQITMDGTLGMTQVGT